MQQLRLKWLRLLYHVLHVPYRLVWLLIRLIHGRNSICGPSTVYQNGKLIKTQRAELLYHTLHLAENLYRPTWHKLMDEKTRQHLMRKAEGERLRKEYDIMMAGLL